MQRLTTVVLAENLSISSGLCNMILVTRFSVRVRPMVDWQSLFCYSDLNILDTELKSSKHYTVPCFTLWCNIELQLHTIWSFYTLSCIEMHATPEKDIMWSYRPGKLLLCLELCNWWPLTATAHNVSKDIVPFNAWMVSWNFVTIYTQDIMCFYWPHVGRWHLWSQCYSKMSITSAVPYSKHDCIDAVVQVFL